MYVAKAYIASMLCQSTDGRTDRHIHTHTHTHIFTSYISALRKPDAEFHITSKLGGCAAVIELLAAAAVAAILLCIAVGWYACYFAKGASLPYYTRIYQLVSKHIFTVAPGAEESQMSLTK